MKSVVLVDGNPIDGPVTDETTVIYWALDAAPQGAVTLPAMVEAQSARLRTEYLDWCAALAQSNLGNATLAERLRCRLFGGASCWWTSLIAAKSPVSNPELGDVLKLRTLELFFKSGAYTSLTYRGADTRREGVLRDWCESRGWDFFAIGGDAGKANLHAKGWRQRLPHPIQAFLHLAYFVRRRHMGGRGLFGMRPRPLAHGAITAVTYFPNIDMAAAAQGRFRSHYWGPLHELIDRLGLTVNWVWFFHDSSHMSYRDAVTLQTALNQRAPQAERFVMLEDSLTLRGVMWAVWTYLGLWWTTLGMAPVRRRFTLADGALNFFGVLKDQWYSSIRGSAAMSACLYAAAFRNTVARLPRDGRLIYPWENQGWEHSLLCAWRSLREGPALAAVHTPGCVSAMDFRTFRGNEPLGPPAGRMFPDQLVAFGKPSAQLLRERGWPAANVTEAESLRYMAFGGKQNIECRELPATSRRLLVVTAMRAETEMQLRLLSAASGIGGLDRYSEVVVRPHPFCAVDDLVAALAFSTPVRIEGRPLNVLFAECDVVFVCNSTSAVVEAAWVGLPVIVAGSVDGVDLNPLNGIADLVVASSPEALRVELNQPRRIPLAPETFMLDPNLPAWQRLLTGDAGASPVATIHTGGR